MASALVQGTGLLAQNKGVESIGKECPVKLNWSMEFKLNILLILYSIDPFWTSNSLELL